MGKGKLITWLKFRYHIRINKRNTILQSDHMSAGYIQKSRGKRTHRVHKSIAGSSISGLFIYQAESETPKLSDSKLQHSSESTAHRAQKTFHHAWLRAKHISLTYTVNSTIAITRDRESSTPDLDKGLRKTVHAFSL